MYKLVVGILLGIMFVFGGVLAENATSNDGTTTAPQDFDIDGVIDTVDACLNTPQGAIIINPYTYPEYAGCTCEQVRSIINTTSPCIDMYCFQELLEIRYAAVDSTFIECPEDICEGYTYLDYPGDGYTSCVDGKLREYQCEPTLLPNATICGYILPVVTTTEENVTINVSNETTLLPPEDTALPPEEDTTVVVPPVTIEEPVVAPLEEPKESIASNTYYLTDATINYSYPDDLTEGDDASFQLQFSTDEAGLDINPILTTANGEEVLLIDISCTDVGSTHICVGTWDIPTHKEINENLNLAINYTTPQGTVTEDISLPLHVQESPFEAQSVAAPVIEDFEPKEEILVKAIYEEYAEQEAPLIEDVETFIEKMQETARHVVTEKESVYNTTTDTTLVTIIIEPNNGIVAQNITIIEYIPKEIAESVADISFTVAPTEILNDDPLVMWHFAAVDERVDLSYEVKGEMSATGNTIVVANELTNEQSPWFIIIPMLMIPILVILLIVIPRMLVHREQ